MLIGGRVLQGTAMAIQALAIGIIANYWRGEARRRAMSMIVLAMGLGAVIAYLLSGLIWRTGGTWRTMFWILTGASAIDIFLTIAFIKETKRSKGVRVDYVGCVGLVVWSACWCCCPSARPTPGDGAAPRCSACCCRGSRC